jgi:hypothetical protein
VPTFYEPEYKLSVKYGAQPGEVQRSSVSSRPTSDSGKNAEIRHRIEPNGQYYHYFGIDVADTIFQSNMYTVTIYYTQEPRTRQERACL